MCYPPHIPKLTFPAISNSRAGGTGKPQKQCFKKKSPLTTARDKNRIQFMDVKGNLIEITQSQHQGAISISFEKRRQSSRRQSKLCYWPNLLPPAETCEVLVCEHKTETPDLSQGGWKGLEGFRISFRSSNKNLQLRQQGTYTVEHSMQIRATSACWGLFIFACRATVPGKAHTA